MNIDTIAEGRWHRSRAGQEVSGLLSDRTIIREIGGINKVDMQALVETLRLRVSVKNPDNGQKFYTVESPSVDGVEQPGIWRCVNVLGLENPAVGPACTIQQTLAYGFATTLNDVEARLVGGDNQPLQPERIIQRQYVALDFTKLGDMIEGIESTKYVTNPVIEGKTYNGPLAGTPPVVTDLKWRILSSKPSRAADGSGIITQTLAKNLVMTPDALPTAILLSDEKALLSPFAHDTTSVKNVYVWEYRWIDPGYAQTLRNTISLITGVIDAKVVKVEDGSCNIQVLTQTNTWTGTLAQVWEHQNNSPTFAANQVVDTFSHIPLENLAIFKAELATATSGYKVSSLVDSTNAEGGFASIVQTQDKLFVGTVNADNGVRIGEETFFLLISGVIRTTMWLGVADADLDTAMTTLLTAPTGYTALRVGNNYSGTGSCNITRTMVVQGTVADKIQVGIEYPTFEGERITYHYPGLNTVDAKALYLTLQTEVVAGYKVDSVAIIESRYALTVVQQLSKVQVTPFTTSAVRQNSYVHTFGLVTRATTVYLNVPKDAIDAVKTAILAIAGIIVLDVSDNDNGQGSADITYNWRTKVDVPRSLGAIRSAKSSQFHKETQDRLWIDINLTDKDALATAVALAMAGTAPYDVAAGAEIREVTGEDAEDKTGNIRQRVVKEGTPAPADYSMQESFNPHGLQEATMLISVREYPEVAYINIAAIFALLQTFLGNPMKGRIQVSLNDNGSFMMRALREGTPDWANAAGTGVQVSRQNPGAIGEAKTELATGIPVAGAAALVAAATADADYALSNIQMTERGQGEAAIEKHQIKKSETAIIIRATPALGTQRAAEERTWPLVLNANIDAFWVAALTEGVTGDFVLRYRQKTYEDGGMWKVSNVVEAAVEVVVSAFTSEDRADVTNVVERKQDSAAVPTIAKSTGVNVSVSGQLNALNKYDYEKHTATATSQEVSGSYPDRNGTVFFWAGTLCTQVQYDAAIAAAALTTATDNSVEKHSTQFVGLFNYSIVKRPINTLFIGPSSLSYGPFTEKSMAWNNDHSAYRIITATYTIFYNTTDAYNYDDYSGSGPGGWIGKEGNQYMCKKVTSVSFGNEVTTNPASF